MAETDAKHMRDMERDTMIGMVGIQRRGQFFGLAIGLAALCVSGLALYFGFENSAMVIGGTTVVGLVSVFVIGRLASSSQPSS